MERRCLKLQKSLTTEEDIRKTLEVFTIKSPCSATKTISKGTIEHFPHLKPVANKLHLSGGTIDLLIGTDFVDAFIDIHTLSGEPGEPIAKRNCFISLARFRTSSQFQDTVHSSQNSEH